MRQVDSTEPAWALGEPVNRKPDTGMTPIAGRPNWFTDRRGQVVYVEPPAAPKQPPDAPAWIPDIWRRTLHR
jgi:hypothetical protein